MNTPGATPAPAPIRRHSRFVKTPVIHDVLTLCVYKKGQWVRLAWCDKPSRFHSISPRGNVVAFHYPAAARQFASYCEPSRLAARAKPSLTPAV